MRGQTRLNGGALCLALALAVSRLSGVAAAAAPSSGPPAEGAYPPDSAAVKEFRQQAVAVTFPSQGLTLRGWIYKPEGDGPFPAVIVVFFSSISWAIEKPIPYER